MTTDSCRTCNCEVVWKFCDHCDGDGVYGHDCGEDTCCCKYPVDDVTCEQCGGEGGYEVHFGTCSVALADPAEGGGS